MITEPQGLGATGRARLHAVQQRNSADTSGARRLTVMEAAKRLGVSTNAIYKRIERNTISHERDPYAKRTYIYLEDESDLRRTRQIRPDARTDELVDTLRAQVELLRRELDAWKEEARRKDHIIAGLLVRIPERRGEER
jgi:hypothetical protein